MVEKTGLGKSAVSFVGDSFRILGKYFKARLLISLIMGVVCYIVLALLGLKLKLLISIVVFLFNLVPYMGPVASMIVTAIIVAFQPPLINVLWVTIMQFGLQIVDGVVLSPLILGRSLGVHPIVVFIAIFIGGSVFGILGVVFATPVAAIAALLVKRIRERQQNQSVNG